MNYIDVCSGISAPTMAWKPLGWRALVYSDIEAAPRAVLRHHYPDVPVHGRDRRKCEKLEDYAREAGFQTIEGTEYGTADLLVGGTPCQSFSIAGLRKGMGDERGNLALEYIRLARRARTPWLLWENVPGVFTSSGGEDFRCFLSGLAGWDVPLPAGGWKNSGIVQSAPPDIGELCWGLAWRVLDAQHCGVPQRRRRVFVVGYLGDWRRAAAVLLERHSLSGDPPPSREARQVAPTIPSRSSSGGGFGTDFECDGGLIPDVVGTLAESGGHARPGDNLQSIGAGYLINAYDFQVLGTYREAETISTVAARDQKSARDLVTHTLRADGFDASEDGTGRGTPLVPVYAIQERADADDPDTGPDGKGFRDDGAAYTLEARTRPQAIAFSSRDYGGDAEEDLAPTLRSGNHDKSHPNAGAPPAVAFMQNSRDELRTSDVAGALTLQGGKPGQRYAAAMVGAQVRRLTPRECERLQGFPDDFTLVPYRGRKMADGPRYKMLGNSMAVPVLRWIGTRIQAVEDICAELERGA